MTVPALDQRATGYTLAHAYWLGKAASLAYKDEPEIQAETTRWGIAAYQRVLGALAETTLGERESRELIATVATEFYADREDPDDRA